MIRPIVQVTAQLTGDLALDMQCLVASSMSSKAAIVRIALADLIEKVIRENKGIAEKFAQERALRLMPKRGHLTVVK